MIRLPRLHPFEPDAFPDPRDALEEPNGLLAFGGDLSPERLLAAYSRGIFPWFSEDEPILWWSPDPRCVFHTDDMHVSRRLRRQLAHSNWTLTVDRAFTQVMRACAEPREDQQGTWITEDMIQAYGALHALGHAHSVEAWDGEDLVGGVYGLAVGQLFCGESMFSWRSGGSKAALIGLCQLLKRWGFPLLDAQVTNPHLISMGAVEVAREDFLKTIRKLAAAPAPDVRWCEAHIALDAL
jgi:leucyl/phenylalanyl-tRNA--protein transferase